MTDTFQSFKEDHFARLQPHARTKTTLHNINSPNDTGQ